MTAAPPNRPGRLASRADKTAYADASMAYFQGQSTWITSGEEKVYEAATARGAGGRRLANLADRLINNDRVK